MKKFISVILSMVIMMIPVFSAFSFDTPENITEETAKVAPETDENQPEEKRLAIDWIGEKANEYSADISFEVNGTPIREGKYYRNGNISSAEMPYKDILTQKVIYCEDGTFLYFTQFPFFYIELNQTANIRVLSGFMRSYEENGYYVEEYVNEETGEETAFYFKDGELVYYSITSYQMGSVAVNAKYTITSYEVDDKDISLPRLALNVTPIYNILLFLGLI